MVCNVHIIIIIINTFYLNDIKRVRVDEKFELKPIFPYKHSLGLICSSTRTPIISYYVKINYIFVIKFNFFFQFMQPYVQIYRVNRSNPIDQLQEVLSYFNLKDRFNRCLMCNCDEFLYATNEDVRGMLYNSNSQPSTSRVQYNKNHDPTADRSQKTWKSSRCFQESVSHDIIYA